MKVSILFYLAVFVPGILFSQLNTPHVNSNKKFRIGDNVSSVKLVNLINYPVNSTTIADQKGKYVILDFFDTYCGACIASFPHLLKLQKQFKDSLQIFLVNPWQADSAVKKLFARRKKLTQVNVTLPTVCKDSVIFNAFPIQDYGLPFSLWINKNGELKYITVGAYIVNEKNVDSFIHAKPFYIPETISNEAKFEFDQQVNWRKPMFLDGNGGRPLQLYWYSVFAKADHRMLPSTNIITEPKINLYEAVGNASIEDLYRQAYGELLSERDRILPLQRCRVKLLVKDTSKYVYYIDNIYQPDNIYFYELMGPSNTQQAYQKMMQADLNRYVGLKVKWVTENRKCVVFSCDDTSRICYKGGKMKNKMDNYDYFDINNISMSAFLGMLTTRVSTFSYKGGYPLVDETGLKGKLGELKVETNLGDVSTLNKALSKYGMHVRLENRKIRDLVLSD